VPPINGNGEPSEEATIECAAPGINGVLSSSSIMESNYLSIGVSLMDGRNLSLFFDKGES
jgi:hypothetical protein